MARKKKEIEYITLKEVVETYDKYSNESNIDKMLTALGIDSIKDDKDNNIYNAAKVKEVYTPYLSINKKQ